MPSRFMFDMLETEGSMVQHMSGFWDPELAEHELDIFQFTENFGCW